MRAFPFCPSGFGYPDFFSFGDFKQQDDILGIINDSERLHLAFWI
jgi:hypothetical protein